MKTEQHISENHTEQAVLVAVATPQCGMERVTEYLDELAFLLDTAGGECVKKFVQNLPYPDPKTYLGSGKLAEVAEFVHENAIDLAVFDDELSPSQLRNVESELHCR